MPFSNDLILSTHCECTAKFMILCPSIFFLKTLHEVVMHLHIAVCSSNTMMFRVV
jgi:hypothetical protein